jgi:peptidyl-prolyl cis-trans isomerase D
MLGAIRNFAKSWPARILLGVLALSFVVGVGANQYGSQIMAGNSVVQAGSRTIDANEFRVLFDNYKKQIQQRTGQVVTNELAEQNRLDAAVLNQVATNEAFAELLERSGVRPGDKLVLNEIAEIPDFFDPITGKFDRKTYEQALGRNGLTPEMFDRNIRDGMAAQQFMLAVQNGLNAPRTYGALASIFAAESRDLSYALLTPQSVPAPPNPTDAQLTAFIAENKQAFTAPEMRTLTVALFTPAGVANSLGPVDPAELQKRYNFRKDTLSTPEQRSVVQIPVKDQAAAQQVMARLARGEAPAAVAKSVGVDALVFDSRPRTAISDRKVADAAFRMAAGQTAIVQGDLGLNVVRVSDIKPGHEVTLEEARPMLEGEIRKDMLAEKVYAQTQAYDDAHQAGSSLAEAAQKAGVPATTLGPITAQGADLQGRRLENFPPKILETAFGLPAGGESELIDLGEGAYAAVRVERIQRAAVPPLADIRDLAAVQWKRRELLKALEAKAEAISAAVRKGQTLEAAASANGATVQTLPGLSRQNAGAQEQTLGGQVLGRALAAKPGEVWTAPSPNGLIVGRVANIRIEGGPTTARMAEATRGQLAQVLANEMSAAAQAYARNKLKVKTDPARARAAVGFEPLPEKGQGAEKGAEKKK